MDKGFEKDKDFVLRKFFENTTDAVLIAKPNPYTGDGHPEIVYVNTAFEAMTGYKASEVLGQSPRILQVDERDRAEREKIKDALQAWIDGDETITARVELYNKTKNGIPFWVELSLFPIWNADYTRSYWAAIQRNINQKKYFEGKILTQVELAEQKIKETEKFLANASHEMRTPLNAIIGFSDLLLTGTRQEIPAHKINEYLRLIHRSGMDMKNIIDKLLSAYQLKAFSEMTLGKTDLFDVMADVIAQCGADKEVYCGQSIKLVGKDISIAADDSALRQVFTNIIYNSLKFTDFYGEIVVEVCPGEQTVEISITDNGCGIAESELTTLFVPFSSGEGMTRKKGQGTGLGLALCKKIIEAHSGEIEISSKLGEGTKVSIRIPTNLLA